MDINLSGYYNRYNTDTNYKNYKRVLFRTERIIQSAELNELQDVIMGEVNRFTTKIMVNGEIVSGCKVDTKTTHNGYTPDGKETFDYKFTCDSGIVYYNGYFIDIPSNTLIKNNVVPDEWNSSIGIVYKEEIITENEDNELLNPAVESKNYKTPGAARLKVTGYWKLEDDLTSDEVNNYVALYVIKNGEVNVIVNPTPWIKDIISIVAEYDRDANGNYLVDGMELSYVNKDNDLGPFRINIKEGTANVYGYKFSKDASHILELAPLTAFELKQSEPLTFTSDGWYYTRHTPVNEVFRISGQKYATDNVTHSAHDGKDELQKQPVLQIVKVWQGSEDPNDANNTVYKENDDYVLNGDFIDWSPSGSEPDVGDNYYVQYIYQYTETSDTFTTDPNTNVKMGTIYDSGNDKYKKIYIYGFVSGTTVSIDYNFTLKREDVIYIDSDGDFGFISGTPDEFNPKAPRIDGNEKLLKLGTVELSMDSDPKITFNPQKVFQMSDIANILDAVNDLKYNVARIGLVQTIKENQPTNIFRNMFIDDFKNDNLRDNIDNPSIGVINDAITADSNLILDTDWTQNIDFGVVTSLNQPYLQIPVINKKLMLEQPYWTRIRKIDPYLYRKPPTPAVHIYPRVFRWISRDIWRTYTRSIRVADRRYFVWRWGWWGWNHTDTVGSEIVSRTARTYTNYYVDSPKLIPTWARIHVWSDDKDFDSGEPVDIKIDGKLAATVNADTNGKVDTWVNVPSGIMSGTRVVKLYGRNSTAEGSTLFQAIPIVRLHTTIVTTYWRWIKRVVIHRWWWWDPSAQTFVMEKTTPIHGIKVYFNDRPTTEVKLLLTEVNAGSPNKEKTLAYVTMQPDQITVGDTGTYFEFPFKPTLIKNTEYAFIVMCEDSVGTIRTAKMGERDKRFGKWMIKQPYSEGTFQQSSNLSAWTVYQDEDMQFQIYEAEFDNSKTYEYNVFNVTNMSDFMINAGVEIEKGTNAYFNVYLLDRNVDNQFLKVQNHIPVPVGDYYTGKVKVEAVLESIDGKFSPKLEPNATFSVGHTKTTSYYTSKTFSISDNENVIDVYIDAKLPLNTDIKIEYQDHKNGNYSWVEIPKIADDTKELDYGWKEYHYRIEKITPPDNNLTRVRVTMTTTSPKYRPVVANLRLTTQEV